MGLNSVKRPVPPSSKPSRSLMEQAYAVLREKIIIGELAPGKDVSEPELAEILSMSRTPVREALGRLCLEGFMEAFPRRGYRIRAVTVKDTNNLLAVRGMLEGMAAALAAQNLTSEELDTLDRLVDTSYIVGEGSSTRSFVDSNQEFHEAIARGSRNPRLHALVMTHLEECARLFYIDTRVRDINPETSGDHRAIVAALRARNSEAARQAMATHTENTRRGLLAALLAEDQEGITL